jgi:TRAP-type mannitol/chloroaromatic compound transport system permease large subunit
MSDAAITTLLIVALFALLGSGVWIGLALAGVAWIGMELFSSRPAGDAMAVTIWGTASSWTLTALPLFVWMGEILFRTRLSEDMFKGLGTMAGTAARAACCTPTSSAARSSPPCRDPRLPLAPPSAR